MNRYTNIHPRDRSPHLKNATHTPSSCLPSKRYFNKQIDNISEIDYKIQGLLGVVKNK